MADSSDLEDDDYLEEEGDLEADSDSPCFRLPCGVDVPSAL